MKEHIAKLILIMKRHPQLFVLIVCFLLFFIRAFSSIGGASNTRPAPVPKQICSSPYVNDVFSGSLVERNWLLSSSEVSLVIYYAPWCVKSIKALKHFSKVAQEYQKQISFIAVNCWWDRGECRGSNEIHYFPQIFFHHKLSKTAVHYSGPFTSDYLSEFLQKGLSSCAYLGTSLAVDKFTKQSQFSVIGYFPLPTHIDLLAKYIGLSIASLRFYPNNDVAFGIVTSSLLAKQLGIKTGQLKKYDRLYGDLIAVDDLDILKVTIDQGLSWVEKGNEMIVSKILSPSLKSNALYKILRDGATLMSFVSQHNQTLAIEKVALQYNQGCFDPSICRSIRVNEQICNICAKDDSLQVFPALAENLIHSFINKHSNISRLLHKHCFVTLPLYDTRRTRIEICCQLNLNKNLKIRSITGLACKTNRTLGFVAINKNEFSGIAKNLGLNGNEHVVIVDLESEVEYTMTQEMTLLNLENFILNFTNHELPTRTQIQSSKEEPPDSLREDILEIPNVHSSKFNHMVLNSTKDVLLFYQSSWCGFCSIYFQTLLSFKMHFPNMKHIEILQINDEHSNQLSVSFRPTVIPSLFLFPGNRTFDSVLFSHSSQMNLPNLVDFILRHASPNTKAELILKQCTSKEAGSVETFAVCKHTELSQRLNDQQLTIQNLEEMKKNAMRLLHHNQCNLTSLSRANRDKNVEKSKFELLKEQKALRIKISEINEQIDFSLASYNSVHNVIQKSKFRDEL
uniref:Thioredoxin domain-containing protein 11 n=1 Tax=Phallusia mammillata TaxID=59560 RepID=A0A6F9DVD9_9ASCI|nr:thioredoxin domain-containing protein 11 [Phallusia mammillata]